MLVLSRKKDESIVINNDIRIVVVEIRGDKVRLGIEAPKDVPVHRQEVFESIARGEPILESGSGAMILGGDAKILGGDAVILGGDAAVRGTAAEGVGGDARRSALPGGREDSRAAGGDESTASERAEPNR